MSFQPKRDVWLISDTHFNHSNILTFENGRGHQFSGVDQMNYHMLERWNDTVKPGDIVYHLGDVFFGDKQWFKTFWPKLHGSKRLIVGNHDDVKFLSAGGFFQKIMMWRIIPEYKVVLTHVPILMDQGNHKYEYNIHGHIHWHDSPSNKYKNVCVEKIDYTPIHIEEAVSQWKDTSR